MHWTKHDIFKSPSRSATSRATSARNTPTPSVTSSIPTFAPTMSSPTRPSKTPPLPARYRVTSKRRKNVGHERSEGQSPQGRRRALAMERSDTNNPTRLQGWGTRQHSSISLPTHVECQLYLGPVITPSFQPSRAPNIQH